MGCLPTSIFIKATCLEELPTKAKPQPRMRCLHTTMFIEIVSLEGLQVKVKEAPSFHLVKLLPLDTNLAFPGLSKYHLIISLFHIVKVKYYCCLLLLLLFLLYY